MVLTMLYLPYMLMLRRESFFRFNRVMLLGILFLSLVLPLCNIPWMSLDRQPVVQAAQVQMLELGIPVHVMPEVQVVAGMQEADAFTFSLFHLLTFIYIIGMVVLLLMRLWQMVCLQRGIRDGVLWEEEQQGVRIYCHAGDMAPFSWMRSIVISKQDYDEAGKEIVLHETGHIRNRHSWDVVLLTLVQMLQWWNPLAYIMGISLRDVHEYEADDYVLRQGVSAQGYQLLLIRKAVGTRSSLWSGTGGANAFANNFNHSLTKKRITMMKKKKSNPWMRSKALYVIPVAALALSAFATPKFVAPIEGAVSRLEGNPTEVSANAQALEEKTDNSKDNRPMVEVKNIYVNGKPVSSPEEARAVDVDNIASVTVVKGETLYIETDSIYNVVAHNASYPGGDSECFKFIAMNLRYPKLCQEFGVQGRIIVSFVIEKDGSITHITKVRGPGKTLSEVEIASFKKDNPDSQEQLREGQDLGDLLYEEATRVLKMMPKWEPAKDKDGNIVRSRFNLPIIFRLN